jgi:hypothetical protein
MITTYQFVKKQPLGYNRCTWIDPDVRACRLPGQRSWIKPISITTLERLE